jgi:hypothetical protein
MTKTVTLCLIGSLWLSGGCSRPREEDDNEQPQAAGSSFGGGHYHTGYGHFGGHTYFPSGPTPTHTQHGVSTGSHPTSSHPTGTSHAPSTSHFGGFGHSSHSVSS